MISVKVLEKGSFFGERALFGVEKRNASRDANREGRTKSAPQAAVRRSAAG